MAETPLDRAHAAMQAAPEDVAARLAFYGLLAAAELFLLLKSLPASGQLDPELFEVEDGTFALVFDREDRLTGFIGQAAPYAAMSGRAVARMLAGQGIGLGLNLDAAPSSILIQADAVDWLAATLDTAPVATDARPLDLRPPRGIPQALLGALDAKLAAAAGLARCAYLAAVTYAPARPGHLLAFVDAVPGAEPALAQAAAEALAFSGLEAGEIDVAFFGTADPMAARLARTGLRFDLPQSEARPERAAPGMDPHRPPKLR